MRRLTAVLVFALFLCVNGSSCEAAARGSELIRQMKRTGKPALIIAGNESCVYCRVLAKELATVEEIQPLVRQFLVLKVDTDSADWPAVRDALQFDGSGIPAVFVVRADGDVIYSESGKPNEVGKFLQNMLDKSGTILDAERLQALSKAERDAQRAMKRRDFAQAISLVKEYESTGSYAESDLSLQALHEELVEKAVSESAAAEAQITRDEKPVAAALTLVRLRRTFTDLTVAAESVNAVWDRLSQASEHVALLNQAEQLDQAIVHTDEREWEDAVETYRAVIDDAPESAAAEFAQSKLPNVEKRMAAVAGTTDSKSRSSASDSADDSRKAASYLKFAKVYLKRDPEKARKYLQRAIDAAPQSSEAAEAQRLLEDLD